MKDPWLLPLCSAASAAYAGAQPWFQNELNTCQVYRSTVLGHLAYTFEGTATFREWLVDLMALEMPLFSHPEAGPVHLGFWLDTIDAVNAIEMDLLAFGRPSFLLTGHSKGAAEAVLAHLELKNRGLRPLATRCFEPPMAGTEKLSTCLAGDDIEWTQSFNAHGKDVVTLVPDWPEWTHQGLPTSLRVPNGYGIAAKHGIAAVLAAVGEMA